MDMYVYFIQTVIVVDLILNFFFHIIHLRKVCCNHNDNHNELLCMGNRFDSVEDKLNRVEHSNRIIREGMSFKIVGDLIEGDIKEACKAE